jgi:hypothetical protein
VAEVDTEGEVMVEMVNLEDVEDIVAVATRPSCSNCSLAANDLNDEVAFFGLDQKSTCTTIFPFRLRISKAVLAFRELDFLCLS